MFVPASAIEFVLSKGGDGPETSLLRAIIDIDISKILDDVPYMKLANLEKDSLDALKPLFMFEAYADKQHVYETGEAADRLYILVHGKIAVLDKDGKEIRNIKAPNFFGATAMLDAKAKRTFTAAASGTVAMLSLSREKLRNFKECFKESGTLLETLMFQEARGRMLTTTLLKGGLLSDAENAGKFTDSGQQVARYIDLGGAIHCHPRVPAGEQLVAEGAVSPAVFFVYQGQLFKREYTPPQGSADEKEGDLRRQSTKGKSPRETTTKDTTPRPEEAKKAGKDKSAEPEPTDGLKTGQYVGELGVLKGAAEATPLTAGPGLVALAADGESFKTLLELVPTLRAHLALRVVDSDRMGYDAVFNYPAASESMLKHMKSEYADEAWHFEQAYKKFIADAKKLAPGDPQLLASAQTLSAEYVENDSSHQINIPADCQKKILKDLEAGEIDLTIFDEARKEMRKLTERDTLPRFRKGDEFRALVREKLGAYPEAMQFDDDNKLTAAIDSSAAQAAAFPVYSHSISEGVGDWRQFEVDM